MRVFITYEDDDTDDADLIVENLSDNSLLNAFLEGCTDDFDGQTIERSPITGNFLVMKDGLTRAGILPL